MDLANPVSKNISSSEIGASCNLLHVSEKCHVGENHIFTFHHTLDGSEIPKNHLWDVFETLFKKLGYSLPTSTGE